MSQTPKVAVIYYSATGTVHHLAEHVARGAQEAGAEVRLLRVLELAPKAAIDSNPAWAAHAAATEDVPVATADDVVWADAVVFGSPTRFGNVASQLKQFIDTLGAQWARGLLADKVSRVSQFSWRRAGPWGAGTRRRRGVRGRFYSCQGGWSISE